MSEGHCGNCDHYHHLKQGRIDCIVDGKLHDTGDSCDDYKKRIPNKSSTVRSEEGLEVRRSREAKAAEQRDVKRRILLRSESAYSFTHSTCLWLRFIA